MSEKFLVQSKSKTDFDEVKEARKGHLAARKPVGEGVVDVALPQRLVVIAKVVGKRSRVKLCWSEGRRRSAAVEEHPRAGDFTEEASEGP